MSTPVSGLHWWSLRRRGRRVWLVQLGVFALLAVIAHALRADGPDVWVTGHMQRWQGWTG